MHFTDSIGSVARGTAAHGTVQIWDDHHDGRGVQATIRVEFALRLVPLARGRPWHPAMQRISMSRRPLSIMFVFVQHGAPAHGSVVSSHGDSLVDARRGRPVASRRSIGCAAMCARTFGTV